MGNGKLEKALLRKDDLDIEIFPPIGSDTDDKTKFQSMKVHIAKDFEHVPNESEKEKLAQEYREIANDYFLKTYDLIRLHTRQFLSGNPMLNATEQVIVTIKDEKGNQLFERMYATFYLRPEDENEFALDQSIWNKVVDYLVNGKAPEVYYSLLLDAKYHASAGKIREAIINIAVAIEQFTMEDLGRNKREEDYDEKIRNMDFTGFFVKAVLEAKNKSIKEYRKEDYHRLKYLFASRNNIAHGRGCYFNVGESEGKFANQILGPLKIESKGRVEIDRKMCIDFANYMFALLDWIKSD